MLSILGRMNPAVCLGGGGGKSHLTSLVLDDDIDAAPRSSSPAAVVSDEPSSSSSSSSFFDCSLLGPRDFRLKYHPVADDEDGIVEGGGTGGAGESAALRRLGAIVPVLLARISSAYPPPSPMPPPPNLSSQQSFVSAPEYDDENENDGHVAECNCGAAAELLRLTTRERDARATDALRRLHDLTTTASRGGGGGDNRAPLVGRPDVCGDVVGALTRAILGSANAAGGGQQGGGGDDCSDGRNNGNGNGAGAGGGGGGGGGRQRRGASAMNEDRRLACWALSNLAMPPGNKVAMLLVPKSSPSSDPDDQGGGERVLRALTFVIGRNLPESYICCICLLNLTCGLRSGGNARAVAYYVPATASSSSSSSSSRPPPPDRPPAWSAPAAVVSARRVRSDTGGKGGRRGEVDDKTTAAATTTTTTPRSAESESSNDGGSSTVAAAALSDPASLVRSIERVMSANAPHAFGPYSVQGEAVRWSCGLVRNLTRARGVGAGGSGGGRGGEEEEEDDDENDSSFFKDGDDDDAEGVCALISRTGIPELVVRLIDASPRPAVEWTRDSLEDACLGALCNMAVWRESLEALRRAGASRSLRRLEGLPGIHGYRARAIRCGLGAVSPLRFDHRAVSSPL